MSLPLLDAFTRAARQMPVTCAFVALTILTTLCVSFDYTNAVHLSMQGKFSHLYPWSLVTYVFVVPCGGVIGVPANVALFATWGAAAELALGSTEYAIYSLFTTVVTAIAVFVLDNAVLFPLAKLSGGAKVHIDADMTALADGTAYKVSLRQLQWRYLYWGVWPVAQVIAFALCRSRGLSAQAGPSWLSRRLTLQRLPLAIVAVSVVVDLVVWLAYNGNVTDLEFHILSRGSGWNCIAAAISMFVAWLYERHASGADNADFTLDAFFYPAGVRAVVRRAGETTYTALRPTRLSFLLPPRGVGGGSGAAIPMPVFASSSSTAAAAAPAAAADSAASLIPGTTAEEAERYRLIAREALARRLQEQRQQQRPVPATTPATATTTAAAASVEAVKDAPAVSATP